MTHFLFVEIKQALFSKKMILAVLLGTVLISRPLWNILLCGENQYYAPMELLSFPLAVSDFTPFAPVFAILPYAMIFCVEYNSHYTKSILLRCREKQYGLSKVISVALSGGVSLGLIFLIVIIISITTAGEPHTIDSASFLLNTIWQRAGLVTKYAGAGVYVGRVFLAFLFGMLWAEIALFLSTVWTNIYVSLVLPFVIYQALWVTLQQFPFNPLYLLRADYAGIPSLLSVILYQSFSIVIVSVLAYMGIVRRCRNV